MIDWTKISLKEFAGYLSKELRKKGIETVLVGGACVTIYSENPLSRVFHPLKMINLKFT
jgi:hypothetical protein